LFPYNFTIEEATINYKVNKFLHAIKGHPTEMRKRI